MTMKEPASSWPPPRITPIGAVPLALACALIVANLYYAQPISAGIAAAFGLPLAEAGLVVTAAQLGYGLGLLFLVPLGDVIENRRLIVIATAIAAGALAAMTLADNVTTFLLADFALGIAATSVQILLPYATHFALAVARGRVLGILTSGLMIGIAIARPGALLVAGIAGWRLVFAGSALLMALLTLAFAVGLPRRHPEAATGYGAILRSLLPLLREVPVLRRRALYHAALYGSFSLFWTAVPLLLSAPPFALTANGIALFALAGTAGIVIAPIAGWVADRGHTRKATAVAMLGMIAAFTLAFAAALLGSLVLLMLAAVLIDAALVTNFVLSQRAIYATRPESRSRIGGLFAAIFFSGGAVGSAAATASIAAAGWPFTCAIGMIVAAFALLAFARETRSSPRRAFRPRSTSLADG